MRVLLTTILGVAAVVSLTGCQTPTQGAITGGLLGAGAGAAIGDNNHHNAGAGALIGGAIGALGGALYGGDVERHNAQPRYAPPPPPPPQPVSRGHYETRIVRTPSWETHEERVWIPDR